MKARFLALAALVLGLASCQTEPEGLDVNVGGAVDTTITVSLPETTRANSALGAFENVDWDTYTIRYIFQVFYNGNESNAEPQVIYTDGKSVSFPVRLVPGRHYNFVAWADVVPQEGKTTETLLEYDQTADFHYNTSNLKAIKFQGEWKAMDETRDAFTGHFDTAVDGDQTPYNGAKSINIPLTRPFAKLRVVTTDMVELGHFNIVPHNAVATYTTDHYESFSAFDGTYAGKVSGISHTYEIASYDETGANKTIFADYFFSNNEVVKFNLDVKEANGETIKANTFSTDIYVRRNYLTTIQGNILTDGNNIKVNVEDAFENAGNLEDEPYYVEIWDGKTIKAPAQDEAGNYVIERGSELAWMAAAVNGTLPVESRATSYANKTFVLNADIDLGGNEWTPIGVKANHFNGTFNGNGHTIKGLKITELHDGTNAQAALFGTISLTTTIKNVVIDEAYVKYPADGEDYYASAIAGTIYGYVTFENITVKNSTITGNNKVGAIFAHDGSSNMITVNNCHVDNCHIASEDLKDGGNVGGLIGLFQTGSTDACRISNSSVKNSIIIGINSSNSGKRANSEFIGGILSKDKTNLVLENCVVANNNFSETIDGTSPVTYSGEFDDKFIGGEREGVRKGIVVINGTRYEGNNEPKNVSAGNGEWYATISDAIADGNNEISLGDGEFNTPAGLSNGQADNTLTIVGNGIDKTTVKGATNTNNMHPGNYAQDLDLVLENLTFVTTNNGYNGGFGHAKSVTFRNCKIVGQFYAHSGAPHYFYDCIIDPLTGYLYTYSSNCVFERCTFSASEGKALQIYADAPTGDHTVTITDCEFVAAKQAQTWDGKPVTGIDINSNGAKFTVAINGCTATGFPAGLNSKSTLWNVKDGGKAHATVTVDGIQVWAAGYDKLANYPNIFTKDGNYYVFSVAGLHDLNNYFKANSMANSLWNHEYNIAADIDATGFTWDGVYVVVGNNGNNGIVLNGNNHTISNLTINNCLLCGTPCGSNEGVNPGLVKDITMKNVVVNGDSHDASVFWGNCYTNVNFENVTVDNAKINGGSNVGALVSRTSIDGPNTSIKVNFKNCVVKNSTLVANNTEADPNGASGFIGRAYGNTQLSFENCSVENNTINNAEGLVGGAVYGYTTYYVDGFKGTGACDTFTNWKGLVIKEVSTVEELNSLNQTNAYVALCADIDFQGAAMTKPIELWGNSTFDGMGHKISNVKTPVQGGYATSLFRGDANTGNKVVKNLVIENLTTPAGYSYAAAICSDLQGANIEIDNVHINNSTIEANGTIGGFVGFVSASTTSVVVKNSSINNSNLNGGEADHKRGAVVGRAYGCTVTCEDVVVNNVKINNVAATTATLVGDKGYTGTVTVE